jgi:hypothetical protein
MAGHRLAPFAVVPSSLLHGYYMIDFRWLETLLPAT